MRKIPEILQRRTPRLNRWTTWVIGLSLVLVVSLWVAVSLIAWHFAEKFW